MSEDAPLGRAWITTRKVGAGFDYLIGSVVIAKSRWLRYPDKRMQVSFWKETDPMERRHAQIESFDTEIVEDAKAAWQLVSDRTIREMR